MELLGFYEVDDMRSDLENGVGVEEVYERAREFFEGRAEWAEDIRMAFFLLREHGLPVEAVKLWIEQYGKHSDTLMWDIEHESIDEWTNIGIDAHDYVEDYLEHYSDDYLGGHRSLKELSPIVNPEQLLSRKTMKEIIEHWPWNLIDFIEDFTERGGSLDTLSKKFFDEIGYVDEYREELIDLIMAGAEVDLGKFVACLDFDTMDDDTKESYAEILKGANADDEILDKFK